MPPKLTAPLRVLSLGIAAMLAMSGLTSTLTLVPAAAQTSSAKTIKATDYDPDAKDAPFPDLAVSVSQTDDLIQQGVTLSWTGAQQSRVPNQQNGGADFLQIAQCWGDEPGSNGTRPDRTTCQYGGFNLPGDMRWSNRSSASSVADEDSAYTATSTSWVRPTMTAIPFRSATGKTIASVVDGKRVADAPDLDNNEFFTSYTTNEVSWAGSGADGSGSVSFELQTAQQSPGLGCGTPHTINGTVTGSSCWLVVIPRGEADPGESSITKSGLFWETWKHHLAFRLNFKPTGVHCAIGATERQLSGSELVSAAVGQWQPKLCNQSGGSVFSILTGPESDASLAANGTASAPLALTSRALADDGVTDNLTYAPVALTGISIAFAVDYAARATGDPVPESVKAKERQAFTTIKLNPRLLAKLLTASYTSALPAAADKSHLSGAANITKDPEFLALNGSDWSYMHIYGVGVSDALMPLGRSNAAKAIWSYIMADSSAADFLNGVPDKWGMRVNPYYSTNPRVNPSGIGLELPRDDFPKADPSEYKGSAANSHADVVNLVTWRPYTSNLDTGGYLVLRGDSQSLGAWDSAANPPKYTKGDRQLVGLQAVIGLTDTAAAAKYQVAQAALLNPAGKYVTPTAASLTAAAKAMATDSKQKQVVSFDPTSAKAAAADKAYPLAMPVYAAVNPKMNDSGARADYASFIRFAATSGQHSGTNDGDLPDGYAPLPSAWAEQALTAAATIKAGPGSTPAPSSAPSASTPSSDPAPTAAASPSASSTASPNAVPGTTPADPQLGPLVAVVPTSAAAGLVAALAVPLISRLRRRRP